MTDLIKKNSVLFVSFSILIICYAFLAGNPHPFDSDKAFIIDIWKGVFSWNSYQEMKHNVLDLQPVRDLYFWVIVNTNDKLFVFFNALFWFFTILNFSKVFDLKNEKKDGLLVLILGLHPVAIWSIMWPSAAKHLLSLLFITLALSSCYNEREGFHLRNKLRVIIFYIISLLTQPIFILFPLFIFFHSRKNWRKHIVFLGAIGLTFAIGLIINWYYYNFTYIAQTGTEKTMEFSRFSFALNLLGFSRSLVQVFLPFKNAFYYSPSGFLNLFGIPLFILLTLVIYLEGKLLRASKLLFFLLPLVLIYFKATNIFVSDTYVLLPLFMLIPLLRYSKKKFLIPLYFAFIATLGIREIYHLSQPGNKLEISYKRVPNCKNGILLAAQQLYKLQVPSFQRTISDVMRNECLMKGLNATAVIMDLYTAALFFDDSKTKDQKLQLIKDNKIETPLINLIKDKLEGNSRDDYEEKEVQKDLFKYIKNLK